LLESDGGREAAYDGCGWIRLRDGLRQDAAAGRSKPRPYNGFAELCEA